MKKREIVTEKEIGKSRERERERERVYILECVSSTIFKSS